MIRTLAASVAVVLLSGVATLPHPAAAADLTAAEKLYADLAKLPAGERAKKLLEGAKKEGKVDLLSANYGTEWRPREIVWEKLHPEVKLAVSGVSSSGVAERFIAEQTAGKQLTDVIELSSADVDQVIKKDLTARYPTPMTDKILPKYRGFLKLFPDDKWMPTSMTEHGLVYNYKELSEAERPKDWFDLCNPAFKGKASYEALESRLLIGWYTMLGEDKAKELIKCIGANSPILQQGHSERAALMQAGDHPVSGDILIYTIERTAHQQPEKSRIRVAYSAPLMADAFGGSINKSTPHPYAAALYTDFLLGDENQGYLQQRFRGPLAVKHPFMPDNAQIVTFGPVDKAVLDRLLGYWQEFVTKNSGRTQK